MVKPWSILKDSAGHKIRMCLEIIGNTFNPWNSVDCIESFVCSDWHRLSWNLSSSTMLISADKPGAQPRHLYCIFFCPFSLCLCIFNFLRHMQSCDFKALMVYINGFWRAWKQTYPLGHDESMVRLWWLQKAVQVMGFACVWKLLRCPFSF